VLFRDVLVVSHEAMGLLPRPRSPTQSSAAAGASGKPQACVRNPEALRQRQVRRLRFSQERQHRGGRRAGSDVSSTPARRSSWQEGAAWFWTEGDTRRALAEGVSLANLKRTCATRNSRRSPWSRRNTKSNLPARLELSCRGPRGEKKKKKMGGTTTPQVPVLAKGAALANNGSCSRRRVDPPHDRMWRSSREGAQLGTARCPPYHLRSSRGTSADMTMKTRELASTKYLDSLPSKAG